MTDFDQLYRDYFRDVFLYVRRLSGGNERLAEDVTSEAFFRAMKSVDSFRGDCDVRVWLCQIAKNCYYTHLKQSRRATPVEAENWACVTYHRARSMIRKRMEADDDEA